VREERIACMCLCGGWEGGLGGGRGREVVRRRVGEREQERVDKFGTPSAHPGEGGERAPLPAGVSRLW
jgi:hypothetical protein